MLQPGLTPVPPILSVRSCSTLLPTQSRTLPQTSMLKADDQSSAGNYASMAKPEHFSGSLSIKHRGRWNLSRKFRTPKRSPLRCRWTSSFLACGRRQYQGFWHCGTPYWGGRTNCTCGLHSSRCLLHDWGKSNSLVLGVAMSSWTRTILKSFGGYLSIGATPLVSSTTLTGDVGAVVTCPRHVHTTPCAHNLPELTVWHFD